MLALSEAKGCRLALHQPCSRPPAGPRGTRAHQPALDPERSEGEGPRQFPRHRLVPG